MVSPPILRRIHAAILRLRCRYLPQSGLGKAFTYILDQWPSLTRFVEQLRQFQKAQAEIDRTRLEELARLRQIQDRD